MRGVWVRRVWVRRVWARKLEGARLASGWSVSLAVVVALLEGVAGAHDLRVPVAADRVVVRTDQGPAANQFALEISDQEAILIGPDPRTDGSALLVYGTGASAGSSGLIELDDDLWTPVIEGPVITGFQYTDVSGARGGVTSVTLGARELRIEASGANWPWSPSGPQDSVWIHFRVEAEWWCIHFSGETGASADVNQVGYLDWSNAAAPSTCPVPLCGNAIRELGEACDDGNLDDGDNCSNDCQTSLCELPDYDNTFDAIQDVIFEGYQCDNALCHSPALPPKGNEPEGGLDLTEGVSYDAIVNVPSQVGLSPDGLSLMDLVEPGEPAASFLYEKVAAKTLDFETTLAPMPNEGDQALTLEHLEALELWIRAGAPRELVVEGTADLLGTCLPPDDPLKLDPPPAPPAPGVGVQLLSTAWHLPANSEDETCFATYYDFTETALVPESDQIDCPGYASANNPTERCFTYDRRVLRQDGQSHHSLIHVYTGDLDVLDPGAPENPEVTFGPFTYKPNDLADPKTGDACDPTVVDPGLGYHPDCSGKIVSSVACSGYGPTNILFSPGLLIAQEPFLDQTFADGVYSILPMQGILIWNSHAFNLTNEDTTMAQYLDVEFAPAGDRLYPAQGLFDFASIFIQNVPPFETREYCRTYTMPPGSNLYEISSHTHRRGVRFRIWEPPNEPCSPGGGVILGLGGCEDQPGGCRCGPGEPDQLIYFSTSYTDPVQLSFDPPMGFHAESVDDRTLLYCSLYDNGSTEQSPPVKRQSTSPIPPSISFVPGLPGFPIGGPCGDATVACANEGPRKGELCGLEPDPDGFCDSAPGALDGDCDACPALGGVTTEDEMFALLGEYYVPAPSSGLLGAASLAALVGWARRRRRLD